MKKLESTLFASVVGVTIAIGAPSAGFAGHNNDRDLQSVMQNSGWRHLQRQARMGAESRRGVDVLQNLQIGNVSAARFNRPAVANSLNLTNQNRHDGVRERLARQIRFSSIEAGSIPTDLNLASRRNVYIAPINGTVTITRGGEDFIVDSSTKLTAASAVAVHQALYEGGQTISLGRKGNADGGNLNLSGDLSKGLSGLRIPKGVTVTSDFASMESLNVGGNIINAGNFVAISSNPATSAADISATNIRNKGTGVVSSGSASRIRAPG